MSKATRLVRQGDFVRLALRPGETKIWTELAKIVEGEIYKVSRIIGTQDRIKIEGFETLLYLDEVVEIIGENDEEEITDDSQELTDFISVFIKEDAQWAN